MYYILKKEDLKPWLEALNRDYTLFVPRSRDGFGPYEGELYLDGKTKLSAKEFFLPWRELILVYEARPGALPQVVEGPKEKRVVFGVRPCDARGMVLIEKVFSSDPFWQKRREATSLIGLVCEEPGTECFGWAMGVDPFRGEGLDLVLVPHEEVYLVKVITEEGKELLSLSQAKEGGEEEFLSREKEFKAKFPVSPALEKLKEKDLMAIYEAPFWEELALPCLNCGACTFLCPTCYCFDVQDEVVGSEGVRVRLPEACMFELYSRHASGHNPRRLPMSRFRNRFMHKFKYFLDEYGAPLCVGCGRCNEECPANINLWDVVRAMSEV